MSVTKTRTTRASSLSLVIACLFVTSPVPKVSASWMALGISSVGLTPGALDDPVQELPARNVCHSIPGLVYQQSRVCEENPEAMPRVGLGARLGLIECQYQFQNERWNCTTPSHRGYREGLYRILRKGTRETAFMYAVTSAGVVHAITAACSSGNLTECSCDLSMQGQRSGDGWKWGGCSDNIDYGTWFAETFVDAPEKLRHSATKDVRALMNIQNNAVGRHVISSMMEHRCRCHGVSGSCAVRTCWRSMPNFRSVGTALKEKYENSIEISPRSKRKLRQRDHRQRRKTITEFDLVYMEQSPNYCRRNLRRGIPGTKGRRCDLSAASTNSCQLLCCGRGYNTKRVRFVERCECKFIWCCEVKCKTCETITDIHTCK